MKRKLPSKSRAKQHKRVARPARRAAGRGKTAESGATPTVGGDRLPIVGIGASAGGLEALKRFFGAMPPRRGSAFVVVMHLDPTHESLMPELLAKSTTLACPSRAGSPAARSGPRLHHSPQPLAHD